MRLLTTFKKLILIAIFMQSLSGCAAFPSSVAQEMEEDPNPQINNFL